MSPSIEVIFVWLPIIASVVFVIHFARRRLHEGLSLVQMLIDQKFLIVFLYSGSLLAIYLSCFYFFYLGPH